MTPLNLELAREAITLITDAYSNAHHAYHNHQDWEAEQWDSITSSEGEAQALITEALDKKDQLISALRSECEAAYKAMLSESDLAEMSVEEICKVKKSYYTSRRARVALEKELAG